MFNMPPNLFLVSSGISWVLCAENPFVPAFIDWGFECRRHCRPSALLANAFIYTLALRPKRKKTTARINPTMNNIHAMFAAVPAIPVNPKTPAINATIRKTMAHLNMMHLLSVAVLW
jgi:hypothetical protein